MLPALVFSAALAGFAGLAGATPTTGAAGDAGGGGVPTPEQIRGKVVEPLPYGQGVLWQVRRPGEEPSYVFGTLHLNREDVLAVPEAVRKSLAKARSASFEVLFDKAGSEAMRRAKYTGGQHTLDALIGPDLFADVIRAAEPYGLNLHQLRNIQPWALVFLFSKAPSVHKSERNGRPTLDRWLFEQAERRGIPVHGLETMRQHVSPLMDLPAEEQRLLVRELMQQQSLDQTEIERHHAEMVRHYLEGDLAALMAGGDEGLSPEEAALQDAISTRLFDDRNRLMVERMLPRLREGRAFVAVGAGHLPGHEGVLSLLTEHGYEVQRIH